MDLGFQWQTALKYVGSFQCNIVTDSAALAQRAYSAPSRLEGGMGPSPDLAWSSPDYQPLGVLPSGKGQDG